MDRILDLADAAAWWLRHHLLAAAGIAAAAVALLVGLALLTGGDDEGGKVPDGAVAVVGDTPIAASQLTRWQGIYTKAVAGSTAKPTAQQARDQAFELLAGSAWIAAEAERVGVEVGPTQVTQAIDAYFKQSGAATADARSKLLAQLGIKESDLRFQQRISLLSDGLRARATKAVPEPTAAEVQAAYTRDPTRWATPTRRDLRVVISPTKAVADQARKALDGGATFTQVTQAYSADAALTQSKGVVSGVEPGANVDAFDRPVFSAPQGQLQGPIKVEGGWMVFKVQKVTALPKQTEAQAAKAIGANLLATRQKAATDTFLTDLRKRWKAKTRCTPSVAKPQFCGLT